MNETHAIKLKKNSIPCFPLQYHSSRFTFLILFLDLFVILAWYISSSDIRGFRIVLFPPLSYSSEFWQDCCSEKHTILGHAVLQIQQFDKPPCNLMWILSKWTLDWKMTNFCRVFNLHNVYVYSIKPTILRKKNAAVDLLLILGWHFQMPGV